MQRIGTILWALKTAWRINKVILVAVFVCAVALSVLPAVSLAFNRQALAQLSDFIANGTGSFEESVPVLLAYGGILALIGLSSRVNTEFISSIMDSRYTYGMQEHLMEVINRFDALELVRRNINEDFNYVIRQSNTLGRLVSGACAIGAKAVSLASLCVAAWALCKPVMFITLAYVALTFVLAAVFSKGTRFNYTKFRKAEVKAYYLRTMPMEANIAKEIRVYGCADGVVASWNVAYAERLNMELDRFKATEKYALALGVSFYVFLAAVMGWLLLLVSEGSMPPADILTVFALCTNLFVALGVMSRDMILFDDDLFRIQQMRDLLAESREGSSGEPSACRPQDGDGENEVEGEGVGAREGAGRVLSKDERGRVPVIAARNVSFAYQGFDLVLKDISFDIYECDVVALVGPNGCGKSTLVKLLLGVFQPTAGQLYYRGRPYAEVSPEELRQDMGAFFQDFYLFHHTIAENVAYGAVEHAGDDAQVAQALDKGGAAHLVAGLPQGMHTLARRRIDRTGVLVSHRVGFARMADRVLMMDAGRLVESGTHDELMARKGRYAAFFQEQAQWYEDEADGPQGSGTAAGQDILQEVGA